MVLLKLEMVWDKEEEQNHTLGQHSHLQSSKADQSLNAFQEDWKIVKV